MSNKTTARWANTRVSERLGIKDAKEQVIASLLCAALVNAWWADGYKTCVKR